MPTPTITAALKELDEEYDSLLWLIERKRSEGTPDWEELQKLYVKRDQLANAKNNLRAFYD